MDNLVALFKGDKQRKKGGLSIMWTKLKYCYEGDYIRAYFLGNFPPDSNDNSDYHKIFSIEKMPNGQVYVAIENWGSGTRDGDEEVFKKD